MPTPASESMKAPKEHSNSTKFHSNFDDWRRVITPFWYPNTGIEQLITSQRRNYDATTRVAQLTTECLSAVLGRQMELVASLARDSANGAQQLASAAAPTERIALQADLAKAGFEKGINNVREVSDIIIKTTTEASDLLAKSVGESLVEIKTAFGPA